MKDLTDFRIAIIGLGYVGLPLAVEFGKKFKTIGFDIKTDRIEEIKNGHDSTLEVLVEDLKKAKLLTLTDNLEEISDCNFFIVTVPTPIDKENKPDLKPLLRASENIGQLLKKGDIVVYESTVYPGATEEECVPILEKESHLVYNKDFFVGYSPERINPGDKEHNIKKITKVTSGSTPEISKIVDKIYKEIIDAGTHMAPSIKVAEAAKVIENTQRDLNIALINELSIIFNKLEIDTESVLEASATKWNFLPFRPGLVGGHCIGVDPYYLTHKAESLGYTPEIILSGRRLNNQMGFYVAEELMKGMVSKTSGKVSKFKVLIMGLAFKENCPDSRNNRSVDIVNFLQSKNCEVDVYDPWVSKKEAFKESKVELISNPKVGHYHGIIIAVAHQEFKKMGINKIRSFGEKNHILYDLKHIFSLEEADLRL
ncbi:MAG: Vi polysaccharide biosynthesis UDP-N-acetylglucosamine C-6 dehydrogenase TviB [Gammaproteobacteria bacterium]|nr:Vi polysaccharide biosynthesis UDP-N-acetylglucosamine C-6 dehydrogenase TviB [Gammaproteobacteria bacterium]